MKHSLTPVALGLGSNKGTPESNIQRAIQALTRNGLKNPRVSPLYKTAPVDCEPDTPPFVNAAVTGGWNNTPDTLFALCKDIERQLGRPREHSSRQARIIDIDILLFNGRAIHNDRLTIPHRQLTSRLFVLAPLHDIAPDWRVPGQHATVRDLYRKLKETEQRGKQWIKRLTLSPNGNDGSR
ncbi:MAG: 2-amino-4-hydroxy-6-hydroxymethyldihydropteridine diphosphokinase [Candidatus Pacebacteria bacterium]|nr:2-amino-4-hydroxy-6-hydroxymethyldihydropteridine diphosphokinase [Candidatus Paceibacterota bacterium]